MARIPFQITDPTSGAVYELGVNPNSMKVSSAVKTITPQATAVGQSLFFEGRKSPSKITLGGVILEESQLLLWRQFTELRHQLEIEDDLGHQFAFYIMNFQAQRVLKRQVPWYHTYTVDGIVVGWS